jgi:hypothetical protein
MRKGEESSASVRPVQEMCPGESCSRGGEMGPTVEVSSFRLGAGAGAAGRRQRMMRWEGDEKLIIVE